MPSSSQTWSSTPQTSTLLSRLASMRTCRLPDPLRNPHVDSNAPLRPAVPPTGACGLLHLSALENRHDCQPLQSPRRAFPPWHNHFTALRCSEVAHYTVLSLCKSPSPLLPLSLRSLLSLHLSPSCRTGNCGTLVPTCGVLVLYCTVLVLYFFPSAHQPPSVPIRGFQIFFPCRNLALDLPIPRPVVLAWRILAIVMECC